MDWLIELVGRVSGYRAQGMDQLVPPLLGRGSPDAGLHARTAERAQPEKHLPARGAGRLSSRGRRRRWASPISAPPTAAGTTSPTRRRAPPARASCATSSSRPSAPRSAAHCSTPNPREISRRLLTRPDDADGRPDHGACPFLNLLAASWIQFMNHDWVNHGEIYAQRLHRGAAARRRPGSRSLPADRNLDRPHPARPDAQPTGSSPPRRSSINEVTHWWDGSQIYGSDQATQDRLRSDDIRQDEVERRRHAAARRSTRVEDTGFRRNWWVGLTMLHTLFVREHNAICDMLYDGLPRLGRQPPLQRRAAHQRRGDGQDPFRRMDPGHSAQPDA